MSALTRERWIRDIDSQIYQVLVKYKNVFIHKAKTACLCGELFAVHKSLSTITKVEKTDEITPGQNKMLRDLFQLVSSVSELFDELNEANHSETLLKNNENYVTEFLKNFRKEFNSLMRNLNLAENDPCPIDESQLKIDDSADIQEIIKYLNKIIENTHSESDLENYKKRLKEFQDVSEIYKKEDEKNQKILNEQKRILEQDEINKNLSDISSNWIKDIHDFELQKKIGSGAFAEVFLSYQKSTHKIVALKKLYVQQFNVQSFELFKREVTILSNLEHFAILPFVGVCTKAPFCIITEYMPGGSLFERLHKGPKLDPTKLTIIAFGIAVGMEYLHGKGVIHRDLKSLNILLDADDFPKICDFGMSRFINDEDDIVMSGNAGTAQWMAPEMLNCEKYDQKIDVYSYGILLWELLTKEVPFRGLKEVQVAMAVINNDSRPLIPQSCPQKLSMLIKRCWNKDPKNRPDFKGIVKLFETGEISYPGTNQEVVRSYINQFLKVQLNPASFNPNDASKESVEQIIFELNDTKTQEDGISKLLLYKSIEKWLPFFIEEDIISSILHVFKKCTQTNFAFNLILCISSMIQNEVLLRRFISLGGSSEVISLFLKFGTTSMNKIIECLTIIVKNDHSFKLNSDVFSKLAPFLVSNDLNIRIDTTKLLIYIIENKLYDEDSSLRVLTSNIFCNAIPEIKTELLSITLKLLEKLINLPKTFKFIIRTDGPVTLYELTKSNDENIQIEALKLIQKMFYAISSLPIKIVGTFIQDFNDLISKHPDNIQLHTCALVVFAILLKSPEIYKIIESTPSILDGFRFCFQSSSLQVIIFSLKICFSLLSNQVSSKKVQELGKDIISLLNHDSNSIQTLSASCLTIIIQEPENHHLIEDYSKNLCSYLSNALSKIESSEPALRLSGVLSSTFKGAILLENNNVFKDIIKLIQSEDQNIRKLAYMTIASHSSLYPMSNSFIEFIPTLFESLNDETVSPYPLITICNITLNPIAAVSCIPYFSKLILLFKENDETTINRTLIIIHRILSTHEAILQIEDSSIFNNLIQQTKSFWENNYSISIFEILESISNTQIGKQSLIESKIKDFIEDYFNSIQITDPLRPLLMRIYSRIIN